MLPLTLKELETVIVEKLKGAKSEIISPLGLLLSTACRPKQSVSLAPPPSASARHL